MPAYILHATQEKERTAPLKALCITGNTLFSIEAVADILTAAGMQRALPSRQDSDLTMQAWHERVCAANPSSHAIMQIDNPGTFWSQMASDIFLANYTSALWGWASQGSIRLLEYWLAFDPTILFLMIYTDPVTALAEAISSGAPKDESAGFFPGWLSSNKEMLRIYNRHPERCLLLDYRQCCAAPAALIENCNQHWGLALVNSSAAPLSGIKIPHPLPCFLAHASLQGHPEMQELQREMESSYTRLPFGETVQADHSRPPLGEVVDEYRALLADKARGDQQLKTLHEVQSLLEDSRRELADLGQQLNSAKEQGRNASEENELLILQLHQVQEELKQYFLQTQTLQNDCQNAWNQTEQLQKQHQAAVSEKELLLKKTEELEKSCVILAKKCDDHAECDLKIKELTSGRQKAETENELAQKRAVELQTNLAETREENELLILQLHQVQEELEHYFLQHQQLLQQNRQMESRWQRMLERQPEYTDYTAITVQQSTEDAVSQSAEWKINNLESAGRCYDEFTLNTILEHEVCGIVLKRNSLNTPAPLLRWPFAARNETELLLLPAGTVEEILPRVENLYDLSTADWDLMISLQRLIASAVQQHEVELPTGLQPSQFKAALENLQIRMLVVPPMFRYNSVTLKRSQVNPDYEHLWLQFEGVSFAGRRWPSFEFRLSCADVRPDSFGDLPKFEFPQGAGQAPLENWFIESSDDFGPKFELRFNLPASVMDMAVWRRLSSGDQEFLKGLAGRLDKIIGTLEYSGAELARPWQQWTEMAQKCARLLFTLTESPAQGASKLCK